MDRIRHEFQGTIRPYYDAPDVEIPVQWYFCPPGAIDMPVRVYAFGDSWYQNNPGFVPQVGMTRVYNPNNDGNVNGARGVRPCGTPDQWLNGVSITEPANCECVREDVMPEQEIPAGLVDGNNRVFTLSRMPITPKSCLLFLNGVEQVQGPGGNYSIADQTITFSPISTPRVPSNIVAYYWRQN